MNNVWTLLKNNLKISIGQRPKRFILGLLIPIGILLLMLNVLGSSSGYLNIGVIDNDKSNTSKHLIATLKEGNGINIIPVKKEEIDTRFSEKSITEVIEIPQGYEESFIKTSPLTLDITSTEDSNTNDLLKKLLSEEISNLSNLGKVSQGNLDSYRKALENYISANNGKIQKQSLSDLHNNYTYGLVFIGFLILFMLQRGFDGASHQYNEKEENIYTRIFIAPIKTWQYYLADVLSNYLVVSAQATLGILGIAALKLNLGIDYGIALVILLALGLVSVALSVCIRSFFDSQSIANNIFSVIVMILVMLGGCFIPLEFMPKAFNNLSYVTPTRWAMQAFTDMQAGSSFSDIWVNIGIILLFAMAFFVIGSYKTSKSDKNFSIN
ncbi:ABC transporter permease [Inconstantimicrobium mannanitabidum]|uniref:Multidrug ABC transporter ATP-binding protein n=1 Tax=Inconstantimicrobium mannanitabidum TaxID=1604901 RepID=A0ACB5REA7_9CLOT|nr:ABC transporter permease [Clostridium sp. TW13]GKX67224.1 multidrug ABC transporter ATP-binding protein [Clostridium sp. TW13]